MLLEINVMNKLEHHIFLFKVEDKWSTNMAIQIRVTRKNRPPITESKC